MGYIDLARGFLYHGDRVKSEEALWTARRIAPHLTRNHPMVRETVRMLAESQRRRPKSLSDFATWIGIP